SRITRPTGPSASLAPADVCLPVGDKHPHFHAWPYRLLAPDAAIDRPAPEGPSLGCSVGPLWHSQGMTATDSADARGQAWPDRVSKESGAHEPSPRPEAVGSIAAR